MKSEQSVTLYGFPGSCSLIVMIALEEAAWSFHVVVQNLIADEHFKQPYPAINPKGRVPALAVDGNILTEIPAILLYIAESEPKAELLPALTDPMKRAQIMSRVSWLASSTLAACNRLALPGGNECGDTAAQRAVRQSALSSIERDLMMMESDLPDDGYWFGTFTIADIFAFFVYDLAGRFGADLLAMPRLSNLAVRIGTRPAVIKSLDWTMWASQTLAPKHATQ
jgi:glutathione S-transferase